MSTVFVATNWIDAVDGVEADVDAAAIAAVAFVAVVAVVVDGSVVGLDDDGDAADAEV